MRCGAIGDFQLFVAATNVHTGRGEIFRRDVLTADHVMASACLPRLFQAVVIDGVPYWDGGFAGNPPLWPLFYETALPRCDHRADQSDRARPRRRARRRRSPTG